MISGLSFLHPWFLLGLTALAVPVILHLMNREMPRRLVFPTIRFIMKGRQFQSGRRGLRDLLTLLMRLLLLTALVLLFAGPTWRRAAATGAGAETELVLFYDLSASMQAVDYAGFFARETDACLAAFPGARTAAISSDIGVHRVLPMGTPAEAIRDFAAKLHPGLAAGNHYAALQAVSTLFSRRPGVVRRLCILTDGQRQDWLTGKLPVYAQPLIIDVRQPPPPAGENLGVERVETELFVRGDSRRLRATVDVRNYGVSAAQAELAVVTGKQDVHRPIEVRAQRRERFVLDLENPIGHVAKAALRGESVYPVDDEYHFWIGPKPPAKVTILMPEGDDARKQLELFFLRHALQTRLPADLVFELSVQTADVLLTGGLDEADWLIILDALGPGSPAELAPLKAHLEQAHGIIYFAGEQLATGLGRLAAAGISGVRFTGLHGDGSWLQATTLQHLDDSAPALRPFVDDQSDLLSFLIYRAAALRPPTGAATLLAFGDDLPFLVEEDVGPGVIYFFATGLDPGWSELPTSFCFLPLLRELLEQRLTRQSYGIVNVEIGSPETMQRLEAAGVDATALPLSRPGVVLAGTTPVQVNTTRLESDLRRLDRFEIADRLSPNGPPTQAAGTAPTAAPEPDSVVAPALPLRNALAAVLLLFLAAELLAANLRRSAPPAVSSVSASGQG